MPNSDVIAEICIKENISPEWLVLGNGSMRGGGKEAECGAVRQEFSCFKKDTVYNVLETLEEMLLERGQVMEPTRKAELVCGLCCMVEADAANLRPAQLLRLINGFLPDNSAT